MREIYAREADIIRIGEGFAARTLPREEWTQAAQFDAALWLKLEANPADMPIYRIVNALMASSLGNPNWLLEYWSRDRLMSVEARRQWQEPDLKPLPF